MHHVSFHVFVAEGLRRGDVGTLPLDLADGKTLASPKASIFIHRLLGSSHGPVLQLVQQASLQDSILIAAAAIFAGSSGAGQTAAV